MIRIISIFFTVCSVFLFQLIEAGSSTTPSLTLSHDVVKSWEEWIEVEATFDKSEFERNVTEYVCTYGVTFEYRSHIFTYSITLIQVHKTAIVVR